MTKNRISELLRPQPSAVGSQTLLGKSQPKAAWRRGGINWRKRAYGVFLLCVTTTITSQAETFKTLLSFTGTDGQYPWQGPLVQGVDGNFYGTASEGGAHGGGTVFEITARGKLTTLYSFCAQTDCTDGEFPEAGLVQATDGNFYGTTESGGTNGTGTVFEITAGGKLTTLYSFCGQASCTDGANPVAGLVQAANGNFYGTTYYGGDSSSCPTSLGCGTVFEITAQGKLSTLYSFCSKTGCSDGEVAQAGLVQGTDGNFYGTTTYGGDLTCYAPYGCGTVFKITAGGKLTTLYSFDGTDGAFPFATLIQATDGNFYGTTVGEGISNSCDSGCGTVFKISAGGKLTTLYSFDGADGANPFATLIQATDGNFYGTTDDGGASDSCIGLGCGTVFKITAGGKLTTLYSFEGNGSPYVAGLVQPTNGNFYGTTYEGGTSDTCGPFGCGTVFSLAVGLGPFVKTLPTSGKEGAKIGILGQGFSSSSVVKFGGKKTTTVVLSGTTLITATVPAGALTGAVTVTTGTTTLASPQTFKVLPTIASFTPESGPVGTSFTITGMGLKQATKVTLDGKVATFKVISDNEVTAAVPTGATTGKIAVTTKGGSARSATSFTVN